MVFNRMLNEKQEFINKVIEGLNLDFHSLLGVPAKYALMTGGKRLRPLMCMLCAEVLGGNYRKTKDAFIALELIHNGTLVHDDIIDEDLLRRGIPSAHVKFGGKRAVLTGDALLSLGLKYATKTGNLEIVSWLSDTAIKMIQGVVLQTFSRRKIASERIYMNIAYLKSGSLFEAAAALGGLAALGDDEAVLRLSEFGKCFGIAYQIRDDVCGVLSEDKSDLSFSDISNGDLTLPLIYALESEAISTHDKNWLKEIFLGRKREFDRGVVRRIYEESGALDRSLEEMKGYATEGRKALRRFDSSEALECIEYLLDQYYMFFYPVKGIEIAIEGL